MRVVRLRRRAVRSSSRSRRPTGHDPGRGRRSFACMRRRSPAASWTGRSTGCLRSRPTSSQESSRKSAPASPASRPATRCSRSRRSTATASRPTTRRCPPSCWWPSRGRSGTPRAPQSRCPRSAPGRGCSTTAGSAPDERVLIHGAAGSVGGFAVQLARAAGAHVIGTASAANLDLVLELGAHEAVDAATRFEDAVEPVDVVFDTAGGERLRRSLAVLRAGGRLVSVAEEPPRWRRVLHRRAEPRPARVAREAGGRRRAAAARPSRSSRSPRRARRSRAAWSRAAGARSCWPSPASIRTT